MMQGRWAIGIALAASVFAAGMSWGARSDGADELAERASERLEGFLEEARRTGRQPTDSLEMAVRELDRAAALFEGAGADRDAARCRVEAGRVLRLLGRSDEALSRFDNAATTARATEARTILARALIGEALTRSLNLEDHEGAKASIIEAVRVSEGLEDRAILFEAMALRSEIHQVQGDLRAAAEWVNRALALDLADESILFRGYVNRAGVHFDLANRDDTDFDFRKRMSRLSREDAEHAGEIATRLGWEFMAGRCSEMASASAKQLMTLELREGDPMRTVDVGLFEPETPSDVMVTTEWLASGGGDVPRWLLGLTREWRSEDVSAPVRAYILGSIASMAGRDDEALESYLLAVRLLEQYYQALGDPETRGTVLQPRIDYYYQPMLMLLERERYAEAFELMEASRARVLRDLIMTRERVEIADPETRRLYTELRALRVAIADAQRRPGGAASDGGDPDRIGQLERDHAALLDRLGERDPGLLGLVNASVVPLSRVAGSVETSGHDVLEYMVMHSGVLIWHIGPSGVHLRNVFLPAPKLEQKVAALRASLTNASVAFDTRMARQLFLFLVQPILSEVTTDRLVIVPHGALYEIPFQVLVDPADGRYLVDRFAISYAPSAGVLEHLGSWEDMDGARILCVAGPDLRLAGAEAEAIAGTYSGSKVVAGERATETFLRRMCGGYDALHIAAHARFDAREPMLSHVQLVATDDDDGRLTASEMFALPLSDARLVSLAACETGRVSGAKAGEVMGMPRALIAAGAGSVLLSQWRVDSSATLAWMRTFYAAAKDSRLPDAARAATLGVKAEPEYEHPYFWGAFYLVGK